MLRLVGDLQMKQLENFSYHKMDSNRVLDLERLFKRGLCIHNYINRETNQKNMSKFLYKYFLENPLVVK